MTEKVIEALKACPFCPDGGKPYAEGDSPLSDRESYVEAGCNKCGFHVHAIGTLNQVISKWNTRALTQPAVDVDDLKSKLQCLGWIRDIGDCRLLDFLNKQGYLKQGNDLPELCDKHKNTLERLRRKRMGTTPEKDSL